MPRLTRRWILTSCLLLPFANAYGAGKSAKVGYLSLGHVDPAEYTLIGLREGLLEEGFREGSDYTLEARWAGEDRSRLAALAEDLIQSGASLIVCNAIDASLAVKAATKTMPIVAVTANDPVLFGLVESFHKPGGNITAVTYLSQELSAKRLEYICELAPSARRIGVLMHRQNRGLKLTQKQLEAAAEPRGIKILIESVLTQDEISSAITRLKSNAADGIIVVNDPILTRWRKYIVEVVKENQLPAIYPSRTFVESGGLLSYGANQLEAYRQGGRYAGKILKGQNPSSLPVWISSVFELVLNSTAAKSMGIEVPNEFLAIVDQIVE